MTTVQAASSFWRQDDPVLDADGRVVVGGMWGHQRDWWHLPNFIRGLITGYGGGKTFMLGKRMISLALENAPVPVMTVSPTYTMAEMTIVQTIDELLQGRCTVSRDMRYRPFRSRPFRFDIFRGGRRAQIICMSGERPSRLKGSNIAAAGIDEPFIQEKAVFEQVLSRIRHPAAKRRELNLTGTPEGVVGWGYELFEGDLRGKHDVGVVQRSSHENRALSPEYLQRLESAFDDASRAAYVEGKFVNLSSGRVYYGFDITVNASDEEPPEGAELGCGMDFNVDPMAFVVFWRKGDRLHFFREFELPDSDTAAALTRLRAEFPKLRLIYPDASGARRTTNSPHGRSDFTCIREAGYTILARPSNPPLRDRYNSVNKAMRDRKVTVGSDCKRLRSYLASFTHESAHKPSHKAMGHLLDAFGYPIAYLLPVDRLRVRNVTLTGF